MHIGVTWCGCAFAFGERACAAWYRGVSGAGGHQRLRRWATNKAISNNGSSIRRASKRQAAGGGKKRRISTKKTNQPSAATKSGIRWRATTKSSARLRYARVHRVSCCCTFVCCCCRLFMVAWRGGSGDQAIENKRQKASIIGVMRDSAFAFAFVNVPLPRAAARCCRVLLLARCLPISFLAHCHRCRVFVC